MPKTTNIKVKAVWETTSGIPACNATITSKNGKKPPTTCGATDSINVETYERYNAASFGCDCAGIAHTTLNKKSPSHVLAFLEI
jgi:hypothetical protein